MQEFYLDQITQLELRIGEKRRHVQVLAGPRQVGKTTTVLQAAKHLKLPYLYATADAPGVEPAAWIQMEWDKARHLHTQKKTEVVLILDEVQKIQNWSEHIKKNWDEDTRLQLPIHVFILGSAPLLIQKGLTESLAGRFETLPFRHWSFLEMKKAFGFSLDQYIFFGGYPGAHSFVSDFERWQNYMLDSIIETTISRDVLLMNRIDKPALLRNLFLLGCRFSGRELSYQKIMGQLQDAGNTTTLAHYLDLLGQSWMLAGLQKYSGSVVRQRGSSPKFQVFNNALMSAQKHLSFDRARENSEEWGHYVESAVGCQLFAIQKPRNVKITYWREGDHEVDFVIDNGEKTIAIEVQSGRKHKTSGLVQFKKKYPKAKAIVLGGRDFPLEQFFESTFLEWTGF